LSARYEIILLEDETGYQFTTSSGDVYIAYFTEFIIVDSNQTDIPVTSFSFNCKRNSGLHGHDAMVKNTIVYLIMEFFNHQDDAAILYLCLNSDGKERNRHITFGKWFNEIDLKDEFERYSTLAEHAKTGLYSSILFKKTNPNRLKLIESFYYTISYYLGTTES